MLTRKELLAKYLDLKWVSPYKKIIAMADREAGVVEVHEFHARSKCIGGAAWEIYHYPLGSNLVLKARREGARNIFTIRIGETKLNLEPGLRGAGIESVDFTQDEIRITYAGLAGGGIAATVCRGLAEGVKGVEIFERGGGSKLGKATLVLPLLNKVTIGVDDTDTKETGATWGLVNEIAYDLEQNNLGDYINHVITQLYPKNPYKTTNCVSIAASFAVRPDLADDLVAEFESSLRRFTLSDNTGMVIYRKCEVPASLVDYGKRAKTMLLSLDETKEVAKAHSIELKKITGERGLIGALASIAYSNDPDEAVIVYD
ncbi:MAG: DUF1743 domain-containing protein [Candidatus Methylarchaceae archaeon HK01M]|nr:DUF1743 domain-containing protein [Candidatus Methylarchaceae archaeon HK01M]